MTVKSLYYLYFIVFLAVCVAEFPEGVNAALFSASIAILIVFLLRRAGDKADDLIKIFLAALILRTCVSTAIDVFHLTNFFAFDWNLYDKLGFEVAEYWNGNTPISDLLSVKVFSFRGTAWGISLLVGSIYSLVGRNILAAQLVIATIGAAAAPVTYLCSYQIYNNRRVALIAGYIVAFSPSLTLWSSLILKDGLIIFFLVLTMYAAVRLQEKFDYKSALMLLVGLIGVMALRNYVFYVAAAAVVGGFLIGQKNTLYSMFSRAFIIVFIGVTLGYIGILNNAQYELENMTSLEAIQISRQDLSQSAASGFGQDYDVSTVQGSLSVLPIGFANLMFAPFPWQITSDLASLAFPETFVWWLMMLPLVVGLIYTVRHRLRRCISVLVFTLMLTIGYSVLQGNVGTAYRQRSQIQVFLFVFIAVGLTIIKERKENRLILQTRTKAVSLSSVGRNRNVN